MVLYDFSADISNLWSWLIKLKDSALKIIIKVYSSLISKFESSSTNIPVNETPNRKSLLEQMIGSRSEPSPNINEPTQKSLRNEYKHDSNTESTPLYKDWRVWAVGALFIIGVVVMVYFYSDRFNPFQVLNQIQQVVQLITHHLDLQ
uniref:hypothetical protein n=1 Tax=Agaricus bitorquis TaxID=5343 RepID=UPI002799F982|nr:hypothetical protein QLP03_mgp072 [Agaricus bitorquis]WFG53996.1 hypothetical protein [Agaricus bitorquis]